MLFIHIFLGQIWSQNLKFFKLIEIWWRGRLLYAYFDFNVYFFKIFVIHIFWANLVLKSEFLYINLNLVQSYIAICLLRFQCLFSQRNYHSYNFGQIRKISKYYGQMSIRLVFSVLKALDRIYMLNFSKYREQQILG